MIVIENMVMPIYCGECELCYCDCGQDYDSNNMICSYLEEVVNDYDYGSKKRHPSCPLKEVKQ